MKKCKISYKHLILFRLLIIVIGSLIQTYGIDLAIHAGFGSATLAVLWEGVSNAFSVSLGTASYIIAIIMLIITFFIDRTQLHIGTIIYQTINSIFIDLFLPILVYPSSKVLCFFIMLAGLVISAFGIGLYSSANYGKGSFEALVFAICHRFRFQTKTVRMFCDALFALLGYLLGGKIGICTICTFVITGYIIQFTNNKLIQMKNKYIILTT